MAQEQRDQDNFGWHRAAPGSPAFVRDFENVLNFLLRRCHDDAANRNQDDERFFLDHYNAFVRLSRAVQCYAFSCYFGRPPL